MRILCREHTVAVHTHYDLFTLGPHQARIALAEPRHAAPREGATPQLVKVFEHATLALSPSGLRVATRFPKEGLCMLERATARASRSTADAFAFLSNELLLSVRPLDGARPERGLFRGQHGANPNPVAVPPPITVTWPTGAGRIWRDNVPFGEATLSASAQLVSNSHGHTIADAERGLVIRLSITGANPIAYRIPTEGAHSEVALTATATDVGFVTVHSGGRGAGAVNHFASDGRHLGALPITGNASDVFIGDSSAMVLREMADNSGHLELVVASLPELNVLEVTPTRLSTYDGYPGLDARDEQELWLGNGVKLRRFLRSTRGWEDVPVKLDEIPVVTPTFVSAQDALRPPAPTDAASAAKQRQVVHPKFGVGRVIGEEGRGEQQKLKIEFADGVRLLLARFVKDA